MSFAEGSATSQQPYKYNGKELDTERGVNLYDYSARLMDPALGRFNMVDPLAEKYYWISPYVYCLNSPVRFIDPDGRDWRDVIRGISEAFIDDVNPNPLAPTISSSSSASNESHYNIGQVIGHMAAALVGAATTIDGGKNMVAGAAIAVAGSETVVLVPAGAAVVAGGAVEAEYGIMTMSKAAKNIGSVGEIKIKSENKINRKSLNPPTKPGNAPTFKKDGKSVEIHHEGQNPKGPFKEMHPNQHRGKGNDAINHPNKNKPSQIDRKEFNKAKKEYWKNEYGNK